MDFDFSFEKYGHLRSLLGHYRLIGLFFVGCLPVSVRLEEMWPVQILWAGF